MHGQQNVKSIGYILEYTCGIIKNFDYLFWSFHANNESNFFNSVIKI